MGHQEEVRVTRPCGVASVARDRDRRSGLHGRPVQAQGLAGCSQGGAWGESAPAPAGARCFRAGYRRVLRAPFDERGQATVQQALAVRAHGDAPLQQALGRGAAGAEDVAASQPCAASAAQALPRRARRPPSGSARAVLRHLGLQAWQSISNQRFAPAGVLASSYWIDSNDFQVGARMRRAADLQQPVVRAHERVFAPAAGPRPACVRTRRRRWPGRPPAPPGGPRRARDHRRTSPRMQVTVWPPIQVSGRLLAARARRGPGGAPLTT